MPDQCSYQDLHLIAPGLGERMYQKTIRDDVFLVGNTFTVTDEIEFHQ
jgi:hypothetical protein